MHGYFVVKVSCVPEKSAYSLYIHPSGQILIGNVSIVAFIVLDLHLRIKQSYTYHLKYAVALHTEMGEK